MDLGFFLHPDFLNSHLSLEKKKKDTVLIFLNDIRSGQAVHFIPSKIQDFEYFYHVFSLNRRPNRCNLKGGIIHVETDS